MLKANGVRTVVASDYSAGRRALALACGADTVVDPADESPFDAAAGHGHLDSAPQVFELAVGTMEKLRRIPLLPWERVWRAAETVGAATPKHPVVFECVGVPGVIDQLISRAPIFSRVIVVGVCMEPDRLRPAMAINKEIELRFVLGYTPLEFRDALHLLADGKVNAAPVLTGIVGLEGVDNAFTALGDPENHAKILIDPTSEAVEPQPIAARA
jgi:threonine dehydrogenase-like Zn-dependent dehydrogenase